MENRFMLPSRTIKKFKVLVGTPHYEGKNYCLEQYIKNVKGLTYDNHQVLVVDNSKDNKNMKHIQKQGVPCVHLKRKEKHTRKLLAEAHEYLRETTLKGGYDYLLHFESDITPPSEIIEHLISHQLGVVSAPYLVDFGNNAHLMAQTIEGKQVGIRKTINLDKGSDIHLIDGKLKQGFSFGLGMCLIHKDILKRIEFRYEEDVDAHPDTFFSNDLEQLNIPQYLDTSIMCDHDNRDWLMIENR